MKYLACIFNSLRFVGKYPSNVWIAFKRINVRQGRLTQLQQTGEA